MASSFDHQSDGLFTIAQYKHDLVVSMYKAIATAVLKCNMEMEKGKCRKEVALTPVCSAGPFGYLGAHP